MVQELDRRVTITARWGNFATRIIPADVDHLEAEAAVPEREMCLSMRVPQRSFRGPGPQLTNIGLFPNRQIQIPVPKYEEGRRGVFEESMEMEIGRVGQEEGLIIRIIRRVIGEL